MTARNLLARIAAVMLPMTVAAITNPPYDIYPYVADSTDNPPFNYTKVCEPGRTGEGNATYVVLGVFWPRAYAGLQNQAYDGDLVIPAYIDGLPVRRSRRRRSWHARSCAACASPPPSARSTNGPSAGARR